MFYFYCAAWFNACQKQFFFTELLIDLIAPSVTCRFTIKNTIFEVGVIFNISVETHQICCYCEYIVGLTQTKYIY